ncbi:MAG TPA: hypothetical protein VFQ79_22355 [Bryobacteraceae bacterium]|nr:hypothetical protein [Bryobacteraceae bacterium]
MSLFHRSVVVAAITVTAAAAAVRVGTFPSEVRTFYTTGDGLPSNDVLAVSIHGGKLFARTAAGGAVFGNGKWIRSEYPAEKKPDLEGLPGGVSIRQTASHADGRVAVAVEEGLFLREPSGKWSDLYPHEGSRSWHPKDVRGVAFDVSGRFWFASPQGVGRFDGTWKLYTGHDGLPYNDFTTMATGEKGVVWFGTGRGAIRFDGSVWEYRQGLRWLPSDEVRSIAVEEDGDAWFATPAGVGLIERRSTTLSQKARFFEDDIDKRHRRTPYGYVDSVSLERPDDLSKWTQHDSDNDGLWTSMYGAGECFAYAATRDPLAKKRADAAFRALRFLGEVTRGGSHPAPPGFVARTILPTSGPNPNTVYTPERDRERQATRDALWKVIVPRWPTSADGKWYWKTDTSSDELDGHYFFYAVYYDLVAANEDERRQVRDHVAGLTDHLIRHGYNVVDHDGKPTRWGVFSPEKLNHDPLWFEERALNSLSILSYLRTAEHITGNPKYGEAARELMTKHAYAMNVMIAKTNAGPGSGNQSDDEMAFMNFYCLLKYEKDPKLRSAFAFAFSRRWMMERYELNPLFNFIYAAVASGIEYENAFGRGDLSPAGDWLAESIDTLKRYPINRVSWGLSNSHRTDIVLLPLYAREEGQRGSRRDGRVLPIDERFVDKWNHDPWALDYHGNGRRLADGASFLLPYYMGLYHGFIAD